MTTNEISLLIKNTQVEINNKNKEIEVFNITLDAIQSNNLDTKEVKQLIEIKKKKIIELNKNINAYLITNEALKKIKNTKEEISPNIEETNTQVQRVSYALVVADQSNNIEVTTEYNNHQEQEERVIQVEEERIVQVEEEHVVQDEEERVVQDEEEEYNGKIIVTYNVPIDGSNMPPLLKEFAKIRKDLDSNIHNINNDDEFCLIGTKDKDIYIIANNKKYNGQFDTDLKNGWTSKVPLHIINEVTDALYEALHDNNEYNITEDYNSDIIILYVDKNVKNSNFTENYRIFRYIWS